MNPALKTEGLSKRWGAFQANQDVDLALMPGERHALIGPNGAGKTTLLNMLTGTLAPSAGQVWLGGEKVTRMPVHQRVKRGMTRTYQINSLFPGLTVRESVLLAILERESLGLRWFGKTADCLKEREEADRLLQSLRLNADADQPTRLLPYGKQRLLEIALGLATRPKVLLLDEPAAGVPIGQSAELFGIIAALPRDVTILFIEHDMNLVFRFAEQITVLVGGKVLARGTPQQIAANDEVRRIYLGESDA